MSSTERLTRLSRLVEIRRLREEQDRAILQRATVALAEVEGAMDAAATAQAEARDAGRLALETGDRGDWIMADAQGEVAGWNRGRLVGLRTARQAEIAPAMQQFLTSRRESEQIGLLLNAARLEVRVDEDRRAQSAADDWFLARRTRRLKRRRT